MVNEVNPGLDWTESISEHLTNMMKQLQVDQLLLLDQRRTKPGLHTDM